MSTKIENKSNGSYDVIRFDNKLVYQGSYHLPVRALKTLCHIIAKYVDPQADSLPDDLHIPLKEIENAIKMNEGANWKSLYTDIDEICRDLTSNPIRFKTQIESNGVKLRGYVNWCSSAVPYRDDNGNVLVRFGFDKMMSHFLLGLVEYVRLYRPELNRLKRGYGIRLFQMLKGIRNKRAKYEQLSVETYKVEHLKFLFALSNKYKQFKDFNKRVLKPAIAEINEKTSILILKVQPIREARKIVALEFHFTDQEPDKPFKKHRRPPSDLPKGTVVKKDLDALTYAKENAYRMLTEFGVEPGIAFLRLLPTIKGSEFEGFEDYFVEYALQHFKQWAKQQKNKDESAATFVTWWTKKGVFDTDSDVWSKMLEKMIVVKKAMQLKEDGKWENRMLAKEMTAGEFRERMN